MKTASHSGNLPTCFKGALQPCSWYTGLKLFKKKSLARLKLQAAHLGALASTPNFRIFPGKGFMGLVHYQSRNGEKETQ